MRRARILTAVAVGILAVGPLGHTRAQTPTPRHTIRWGARTPTPTPTPAATAAQQAPSTVYVSVARATIRDGETPAARTIAEVAKGTELRVISSSGQRLKVEAPNRVVGYIVKLNTSATKPKQDDAGFSDLLKASRGGDEASSGGSIRGIRAPRAPGVPEPPDEALANARAIGAAISEDEVRAFMAEGKVTPP